MGGEGVNFRVKVLSMSAGLVGLIVGSSTGLKIPILTCSVFSLSACITIAMKHAEPRATYLEDITILKRSFHSSEIIHIPRTQNSKADSLARSARKQLSLVVHMDAELPMWYMPNSTRSNKETKLLFSPDPASLERSIRKEARSSSIDNNTCSSLDFFQPPSSQTLVPSTDTRSPPSTEDTHLPSTDIVHPTSIDTPSQTSINTELRDKVVTLILVRDDNGDLHDQNGHLRNAAEHRLIPTESSASCYAVRILTHEEFTAKHPHSPIPDNVRIARRADTSIDRHGESTIARQTEAAIDRQPPAPIDRRAPVTYRVQMPKIDVARLNALRPKPKPSENPPETVRTPLDDGEDPMEEDKVPTGRTLRRRKEKVAKHLKRGANEKEKENF
ncbi:hypothetical protein F2Q70_00012506 [Brassica cretica]|uniref:RNase H type-1 domain-containing protein n=1 Tax=Brassica cretica TaxID=69181 RepID=A0A8S9LRT9_BRACR|nr:hypothetical protein F2Q70_00012506 [Brassica cretica]